MSANALVQRLPRHLKMSELRVFAAVMEHRSFHKAAAAVHLTQPAVTKAIAGLEEKIGAKLFDRRADGVEPTVHALSLAPRAATIFDEVRRAAQDLAMVASGASGTLRIGSVPMPAIPFLPIAIQRLTDAHPKSFVSVVEAREAEILDRLRKGEIELAILRLALLDLGRDLEVAPLFEEKLCVIANREHPLAKREQVTWPELLEERWVMPPPDCLFSEYVQRTLDANGLQMPRRIIESFSINIQFGMVLHGGMLAFGMRSSFDFSPGKVLLVRLPFELSSDGRAVAAVSLKSHELSPLAQQLIGHIRDLTRMPQPAVAEPAPHLAVYAPEGLAEVDELDR